MPAANGVEILEPAEIDRLWQHRQAVDTHFNERLNFFLVFESVLLAVVGLLLGSEKLTPAVLRLLISLGLVLTIVWWYAQGKQKYILDLLRSRCEQHMPEYRAARAQRTMRLYKPSVTWLLAHLVPVLVAAIWLILLFTGPDG